MEKLTGVVRNIRMADVQVQCREPAVLHGNPADKVANSVFRSV